MVRFLPNPQAPIPRRPSPLFQSRGDRRSSIDRAGSQRSLLSRPVLVRPHPAERSEGVRCIQPNANSIPNRTMRARRSSSGYDRIRSFDRWRRSSFGEDPVLAVRVSFCFSFEGPAMDPRSFKGPRERESPYSAILEPEVHPDVTNEKQGNRAPIEPEILLPPPFPTSTISMPSPPSYRSVDPNGSRSSFPSSVGGE